MNDLPPAVADDLISLGNLDNAPSATRDELLARITAFIRAEHSGSDRRNEVAGTQLEVELRNLVRGLTADFELGWHGGFDGGVRGGLA